MYHEQTLRALSASELWGLFNDYKRGWELLGNSVWESTLKKDDEQSGSKV
jgi:hypothetical protein